MEAIIVAAIAAIGSVVSVYLTKRQDKKINETHKQVTVNSHSSATPTVLDLIAEVRDEQKRTNDRIESHIIWHLTERRGE